jgi:nucleotide-binding universal stress UspA family protein
VRADEEGPMSDRTVVGWDGSAAADAALRWAIAHERTRSGRLTVLQVVEHDTGGGGQLLAAARRARSATEAARSAGGSTHAIAVDVEVDGDVLRGDPEELLRAAADPGTLLVLGHRDVPLMQRTHRPLDVRLAASAPGPVAVVPADASEDASGIVVGVDGGPECISALRFAAAESRRVHEPVVATHVWSRPFGLDGLVDLDETERARMRHEHEQILDETVESALTSYPEVEVVRHVVEGPVVRRLLGAAEHARLLVVGTHGRGAVGRLVLGSVSESAVFAARVPTVVVR